MDLEHFNRCIAETASSVNAFVAMLALPNCPHCDEYYPTFVSVCNELENEGQKNIYAKIVVPHGSEIKRQHLRAEIGERVAAPATLVFRKGQRVARHFGKLTAQQLRDLIAGKPIETKQKTLADLDLPALHELLCQQRIAKAEAAKTIAAIQWEISKR